jgi:predicted flap endonuclease-1-like 5' DNA nuclease
MIYLIFKILGFILAALAVGWWLGANWYRLRLNKVSAELGQMRSTLETTSQTQLELLQVKERNLLDETHRRRDLESRLEEQVQFRVIAEQRSSALEGSLDRETAAVKAMDAELRSLREANQKALARARESAVETESHIGKFAAIGDERDRLQQENLRLAHRVSDLDAELVQVRQRIESSETERLDLRIRLEAALQERDEITRRVRTLEETSRSRTAQAAPQPAMQLSTKPAAQVGVSTATQVTAPLAQRFSLTSGKAAEIHEQPPVSIDDLTQISGIGRKLEKQLNALGIYQLTQLASLSPEQICWVDEKLSFRGRIHREDWVGQAIAMVAPAVTSSGDQA